MLEITQLVFLESSPCNAILDAENFKLLEINAETTQQKICTYGLATLTSSNKKLVQNFITCMYTNRRITNREFKFKMVCSPSRASQNCPTYYIFSRKNTYDCREICWDISAPYAIVCNKRPKSYTNTILSVVLSFIVLATVCIWSWRNRKSIKVSYLFCCAKHFIENTLKILIK